MSKHVAVLMGGRLGRARDSAAVGAGLRRTRSRGSATALPASTSAATSRACSRRWRAGNYRAQSSARPAGRGQYAAGTPGNRRHPPTATPACSPRPWRCRRRWRRRCSAPPVSRCRRGSSHPAPLTFVCFGVCAVTRRRFPVGASPTRQPLQPEATGAVMEVTKWLKPSDSGSRIGDRASVQAATRVNAEQASKRTMRRPTR